MWNLDDESLTARVTGQTHGDCLYQNNLDFIEAVDGASQPHTYSKQGKT